jgi:hypothetical protein
MLPQITIEIQGLNQEEFDNLISDPEYLALFTNLEGYENILTPEQIEIINSLLNL